jgi:Trp operon repressor
LQLLPLTVNFLSRQTIEQCFKLYNSRVNQSAVSALKPQTNQKLFNCAIGLYRFAFVFSVEQQLLDDVRGETERKALVMLRVRIVTDLEDENTFARSSIMADWIDQEKSQNVSR